MGEHKFWSPRAIFIIPYKNNNSDVDFDEKNIGLLTIGSVEKYFGKIKLPEAYKVGEEKAKDCKRQNRVRLTAYLIPEKNVN